jgi:tellurite resistance protein TerC
MSYIWWLFNLFILTLLALDLYIANRDAREVSLRQALIGCAFWVGLALAFNVLVYFWRGPDAALQFLTAYLVEESLSVDNLFVFLMLFSYFRVPPAYQRKVLFFGILGAIVMRMLFIVVGVALIARFHWVIYLFGLFLVYTGYKMAVAQDSEIDPEKNPLLRVARKFLPVTEGYEGERFFVNKGGRRYATPLFIVLLVVESTDLIFAVDSIPAVLAISSDAFIIYSSNVFAVLGLRSLYFALSGMMGLFHYLHYGLAAILSFVGIKMLISGVYPIPIGIALGVVAGILALSILASVLRGRSVPDGGD